MRLPRCSPPSLPGDLCGHAVPHVSSPRCVQSEDPSLSAHLPSPLPPDRLSPGEELIGQSHMASHGETKPEWRISQMHPPNRTGVVTRGRGALGQAPEVLSSWTSPPRPAPANSTNWGLLFVPPGGHPLPPFSPCRTWLVRSRVPAGHAPFSWDPHLSSQPLRVSCWSLWLQASSELGPRPSDRHTSKSPSASHTCLRPQVSSQSQWS